jgi:hypothetical protein
MNLSVYGISTLSVGTAKLYIEIGEKFLSPFKPPRKETHDE